VIHLGGTKQEVGPCERSHTQWADDRLTRLVQECVAQVDHRWQVRAVSAWNRGEPLPPQETEESVVALCMSQAATAAVTETERLSERLADVSDDLARAAKDRDALRADSAQTLEHLRTSNDRIAGYLGEAAKRPPPVATATATATSDGTAVTESGLTSETGAASHALPVMGATPLPVVPAASPAAPAAPAAQSAQSPPEPTSPSDPAAQPAPPLKKAPLKKAQARKKPLVRPASAPCEVPAVTACEAPVGEGAAGAKPPAVEETPRAAGPK
jgi:hypothetical protein